MFLYNIRHDLDIHQRYSLKEREGGRREGGKGVRGGKQKPRGGEIDCCYRYGSLEKKPRHSEMHSLHWVGISPSLFSPSLLVIYLFIYLSIPSLPFSSPLISF